MSLTKLAFEEAQMDGRSFSDYVARSHRRKGKCASIKAEKLRKFTETIVGAIPRASLENLTYM